MSAPVSKRLLRSAALALALTLATLAAPRADDHQALNLEAARATLDDIDAALKSPSLGDADLQRLRAENDPLAIDLQSLIAELTPRVAASKKRLDELTPKSKDSTPATDAATVELAQEKQKYDSLDASLRAARGLKLKVDEYAAGIGARRRELFARETFARSSSVLNPQLWLSVWRETPGDLAATRTLVGNWWGDVSKRLGVSQTLGLAGVALLFALLAAPVHWVARRVIFRDPAAPAPGRLKRALAAVWTIVVLSVLPLLALGALAVALDAFDISDPAMQSALNAALDGARLLIVVNALGRGLLAPRLPSWRMIGFSDFTAGAIFRAAMTIAAVWAAERLAEPVADAVSSLNIAVAARALSATLIGLTVVRALRRISPSESPATPAADPWAPQRTLGWVFAALTLVATLAGYIAFATFAVNQAIFLTLLAGALFLLDVIVQDGVEALLKPEAAIGSRLLTMIGLRRNVLAQIKVLIQGVARIALLIVAAVGALEPWGVQSQDMLGTLRAAYFGFSVGGVTISLSSMLAAAVAFVVVVFATRLFQSWLGAKFLPQTRLDAGVSNSIRTILGYLGFVVAVLIGGAQLGLDLQKFAIIAGALSVGIGFGLQSIANNFVSGLILLWERGIRVGDWIVVGAEQGFVRRINARATEIETFDRGTLIVPNLNLVTGMVKNWVHTDRVGRIVIPINVAFESDAETARAILIDAARANDLVLSIPAPQVLFIEFADWALKLQLIAFVDDVESAVRVASDLNFDILRRMREAGLTLPLPYPRPAPPPSKPG